MNERENRRRFVFRPDGRGGAVLILAAVLAAPALEGRDLDPLEAIRAGKAQLSVEPGVRTSGPPLVRSVRVSGRGIVPVNADGSYSLEGVPVGGWFRVEALAEGSAGPGAP